MFLFLFPNELSEKAFHFYYCFIDLYYYDGLGQ